ncbi:MAG: energy-coupling factor ABC transporter ATP-binding protein [Treponema sp.]|jgi:biotin transport system ATP-binding protein|nr:energy-coupling factor ABC transporter ATP-binding protein [Treponema sp.]
MNSAASGARLEISHITKRFAVSKAAGSVCTALHDVSFSIDAGDCVLIGGANGSGKSVLMDIIAGLTAPSSGTVRLTRPDGHPAAAGLVFQDADTQILGETPLEDVMTGPLNMKKSRPEARALALAALEKSGLGSKAAHASRFLSGGEKRRLAVAGVLALNTPLVIFDEPYANLDYSGVRQVNELIQMLRVQRRTILVLTHELEKSLALCNRFIVLFHGEKVFDGTPQEGIRQNLAGWDIHDPLSAYTSVEDLVWR